MNSKLRTAVHYSCIGVIIPLAVNVLIPIAKAGNHQRMMENYLRFNVELGNFIIDFLCNVLFAVLLFGVVLYIVNQTIDKHLICSLVLGTFLSVLSLFWLFSELAITVIAQFETNFALISISITVYILVLILSIYRSRS